MDKKFIVDINEDFVLSHINTGCLYEKEGQKITIAHSDSVTHFFDHSRMIDGTIEEGNLTDLQVISRYIRGKYKMLDITPYYLKYEFEKYYKTAEFKDISSQYRYLIQRL